MRNKIISLLVVVVNILMPIAVLAGPDIGSGSTGLMSKVGKVAQYNVANDSSAYALSETIGKVIKMALMFVGTIFFALAVYAGFLWMSAQGNEEQVKKAQGILRTGTIGMIIIIASYSITAMVMLMLARSTQ